MIGDLISGALPLLQANAESMMRDTCTIRRRRPDEVLDPDMNRYVPVFDDVYTGPCRLRFESARTESRDQQSQLLVAQVSTLSLPYGTSAAVRVDDEAEITSQGLTVRIAGQFAQTYATARRFPVEALS